MKYYSLKNKTIYTWIYDAKCITLEHEGTDLVVLQNESTHAIEVISREAIKTEMYEYIPPSFKRVFIRFDEEDRFMRRVDISKLKKGDLFAIKDYEEDGNEDGSRLHVCCSTYIDVIASQEIAVAKDVVEAEYFDDLKREAYESREPNESNMASKIGISKRAWHYANSWNPEKVWSRWDRTCGVN